MFYASLIRLGGRDAVAPQPMPKPELENELKHPTKREALAAAKRRDKAGLVTGGGPDGGEESFVMTETGCKFVRGKPFVVHWMNAPNGGGQEGEYFKTRAAMMAFANAAATVLDCKVETVEAWAKRSGNT